MKLTRTIWVAVLLMALHTAVSAQEVKIKGRYNGQKIEVSATRTPQGDIITKLSYAPLTKLESDVNALKNQVSKLESDKKTLEKKIKEGCKSVQADLDKCNAELNTATARLSEKEQEVKRTNDSLSSLRKELERVKSANKDTIQALLAKISKSPVSDKGQNRNGIGLSACIGFDIMGNSQTRSDLWSRGISAAQQFELTYIHYFSKTKPVALKTGIGFSIYRGNASFSSLRDTVTGLTDIDGDRYDGRYNFSNVAEKANIKYLDIPLLLHIGNDYDNMPVQGWFEAGLRMSFKVSSKVTGTGKYSMIGYYPAWNVEMSDIAELGYVTDRDIYGEDPDFTMNTFVLWGQISAGIYVPLGKKLGLNFAARCGYSLTPVSKNQEPVEGHDYYLGQMSIVNGGKTRIFAAGLEIGLTYQF